MLKGSRQKDKYDSDTKKWLAITNGDYFITCHIQLENKHTSLPLTHVWIYIFVFGQQHIMI